MTDNDNDDKPALFLCVDCGGTKTAVAIANRAGQIVARGSGGPSNFAYLGLANFVKTVKAAVEDALKATLPTPKPVFCAAWFGVSGVDSPANVAVLTPHLAALLSLPSADPCSPRLSISNDAGLLAAPLTHHPDALAAVCIIAGTGSITASFARGRPGDGAMLDPLARSGGWGWIIGDEGGGFDVGREAVRSILRAHEDAVLRGSEDPLGELGKSQLARAVMGVFGVEEPTALLALVHDPDPEVTVTVETRIDVPVHPHRLIAREKRLSQLAPLVFDAAFAQGDALALQILHTNASALAAQAARLLRRASTPTNGTSKTVLASDSVLCFGGSLVGVDAYRAMVVGALAEQGHVFKHVEYVQNAAECGAGGLVKHFR